MTVPAESETEPCVEAVELTAVDCQRLPGLVGRALAVVGCQIGSREAQGAVLGDRLGVRDGRRRVVNLGDRQVEGGGVAVDNAVVRFEREAVGAVEIRVRRVGSARARCRIRPTARRPGDDRVRKRVAVGIRAAQGGCDFAVSSGVVALPLLHTGAAFPLTTWFTAGSLFDFWTLLPDVEVAGVEASADRVRAGAESGAL